MKIGELASRTDFPTRTIRFWEVEGLLSAPARTSSGYRDYDDHAADRIAFIRQSQTAGLTLAQIRQILDVADDGTVVTDHFAALHDGNDEHQNALGGYDVYRSDPG